MTDVHDKKTRSFNMSRIRSRDTKPELLIRKFLFAKGFRLKTALVAASSSPQVGRNL